MRIISGKYKGRIINGMDIIGTRPTMDRVKESMFAMIQNSIKNSLCLDLFAGSGALGIEAISNGAYECYFVDNNKQAIQTIKDNIKKLNISEYKILNMDYTKALEYFHKQNIKFDLIFLDPPYKLNLINEILNKIIDFNLLNENGQVICEYENELVENNVLTLQKERTYGSKKIKIYKK